MEKYVAEYKRWLSSDKLTDSERAELISVETDESTVALRFMSPMDFGTAGLRSTMYMGIGCMNRFTVAQATRGMPRLLRLQTVRIAE